MAVTSTNTESHIRVWDPWVRISHWTLAAAFLGAYFVVEDPLDVHVWLGYLVGALVLIRLVWGLVGPRYARFTDFIPSPRSFLRYIAGMLRGKAPRYLGHNPAGGAMIVALLLGLAGTVTTGLMVYGAEEEAGPLAGWYASAAPGPALIAEARAGEIGGMDEGGDDDAHEEAEVLEEVHEFLANLTLFLVGLHVLGVITSSIAHRENLVRAMVTGCKRAARPGERS